MGDTVDPHALESAQGAAVGIGERRQGRGGLGRVRHQMELVLVMGVATYSGGTRSPLLGPAHTVRCQSFTVPVDRSALGGTAGEPKRIRFPSGSMCAPSLNPYAVSAGGWRLPSTPAAAHSA